MTSRETFQLPAEYFEGNYGKIQLSAEEAARRLKIAGIISGLPALILDDKPFREPTEHTIEDELVVRHYFFGPAAYTLRDQYELVGGRWEFEIDAPVDRNKSAYTYFGSMEFGDAFLIEPPIAYEQAAFDGVVKSWRQQLAVRPIDD